jgi:tetratricopeptide (TPR) repeat protein
MTSSPVGRNDRCPCGSGKKYKKCCQAKEPVARDTAAPPAPSRPMTNAERTQIAEEVERLDRLSNGAVDAIHAKRYEEAERLCEELLKEFPDVLDGHDRLGMLREAEGRFEEAADQYARALAIIARDPDGYDQEVSELFEERRRGALSKAGPQH